MSSKLSELRNLGKRIQGITMSIERRRMKWGRNWTCLCGSGKKYKNCCLGDIENLTIDDGNATIKTLPDNIQLMLDAHNKAQEEKAKAKKVEARDG